MTTSPQDQNYLIRHFDDIPAIPCPCGSTRRAFTEDPDGIATVHVVNTEGEAKLHYHKRLTETYFILEGEGKIELDGQLHDVRPGSTVMIKPGCRHRAIGTMKFINVSVPAFDPEDEWFD